jgi:peptide deformylase
MALRAIVTLPNPILRKKARKVTDFGPGLQSLIDDMIETMQEAPGVGLAAPQVNVPLRLFVAEWGDDEDEEAPTQTYILVNPEIKKFSEERVVAVEGCLSIPGIVGEVERAREITVHAQNRHGQKMKLKAQGWLARILQHETDHLNGELFIEKAEKVWKQSAQESEVPAAD